MSHGLSWERSLNWNLKWRFLRKHLKSFYRNKLVRTLVSRKWIITILQKFWNEFEISTIFWKNDIHDDVCNTESLKLEKEDLIYSFYLLERNELKRVEVSKATYITYLIRAPSIYSKNGDTKHHTSPWVWIIAGRAKNMKWLFTWEPTRNILRRKVWIIGGRHQILFTHCVETTNFR